MVFVVVVACLYFFFKYPQHFFFYCILPNGHILIILQIYDCCWCVCVWSRRKKKKRKEKWNVEKKHSYKFIERERERDMWINYSCISVKREKMMISILPVYIVCSYVCVCDLNLNRFYVYWTQCFFFAFEKHMINVIKITWLKWKNEIK